MPESTGVKDQTVGDWSTCPEYDGEPHNMVSVKTNSLKVQFVEQCERCGWIDGSSLNWWADNAAKLALTPSAGRIAIAAELEPFQFVQNSDGDDLTLEEILGQALGAASMCWKPRPHEQEFDSVQARRIYVALQAEVERHARKTDAQG